MNLIECIIHKELLDSPMSRFQKNCARHYVICKDTQTSQTHFLHFRDKVWQEFLQTVVSKQPSFV